jgi:hypothetical protein
MGDLAERNIDYVRLLELEIIYRKRLGTYKRRISGTTYVILYTNQDIDRKREGQNQPTRDIKSNCLGLVTFQLTYKLGISPGHEVGSVSNQIFAVGFILY